MYYYFGEGLAHRTIVPSPAGIDTASIKAHPFCLFALPIAKLKQCDRTCKAHVAQHCKLACICYAQAFWLQHDHGQGSKTELSWSIFITGRLPCDVCLAHPVQLDSSIRALQPWKGAMVILVNVRPSAAAMMGLPANLMSTEFLSGVLKVAVSARRGS